MKSRVPVIPIVLHHMPQDWLLADRYHRLGNALGKLTNAGAQSAAEKNDFHGLQFLRIDGGRLRDCDDALATAPPSWRIVHG